MKKILFVCTGNICRSPTAHAIARHYSRELGLEDKFYFDSAGTSGYHIKEPPDQRSIDVAKTDQVNFDNIFSRKITDIDFNNFDIILCMDRSHLSNLLKIADKKYHSKIFLFLQYCDVDNIYDDEVRDPFYSEDSSFILVYELIKSAIIKLLKDENNN